MPVVFRGRSWVRTIIAWVWLLTTMARWRMLCLYRVTIEKQLRDLPQGIGELQFDALAKGFMNPSITISAGLLILAES
jgi:hypothetical protein